MNEKVKSYLDKGKAALGKVSKKIWIIAAVVIVLVAAGLTIFLNSRPYEVLVTGSNNTELSAIMSWLDSQGYQDYRLEGDTILAPASQATNIKARMLMAGYPQSGYNYSTYYDHVSSLSTESERNNAYIHDLQDRMGAVIRSLEGVKDAQVFITPGSNGSYMLDSGNVTAATASVMVTMGNSQKLSNQQAAAIRALISRGVKGLQVDSVEIIDNWGNRYGASNVTADDEASALKIRLEEEYENKIRTEIMQMLTAVYGEDNVRATVNCTVEVSNSVIDERDVYLPDWANNGETNGAGIIGSRIYSYVWDDEGEGTIGGTVGTTTNSDIPTEVERDPAIDGNETRQEGNGQIDYDNPTKETHTVRTAAYLTDCSVTVTINSVTAGDVNLDEIRNHVAVAANIVPQATEEMTAEQYLASKVSVMAQPFYGSQPEDETPSDSNILGGVPNWVVYAAAAGLLLFILLLALILIASKKRKKKKEEEEAAAAAELEQEGEPTLAEVLAEAGLPQAEPIGGADVMNIHTERSLELRKDIRQFADENPEVAAQMLKSWLKGEDDDG